MERKSIGFVKLEKLCPSIPNESRFREEDTTDCQLVQKEDIPHAMENFLCIMSEIGSEKMKSANQIHGK